MSTKIKVGVVGYGVIGSRCADAVSKQPDMELVGVADALADYRVKAAVERGYALYASPAENYNALKKAGLKLAGTIDDLLKKVDVIIDATPAGAGAKMKPLYEKAGVKAVFQGGEKHEVAGHSFVAQFSYKSALGRQFTRVVSCNTTGICRVIGSLHQEGLVERAWVMLARRATDQWKAQEKGVINTFIPERHIPSHQGPDAQKVIPDLPVVTIAAKGPYTLSHMHFAVVKVPREVTREEILGIFSRAPRVAFLNSADGTADMGSVIELMHHLGRPRGDMWEVGLWEDILAVRGEGDAGERRDEIYLVYQVHQVAIVVPENIDAIRALTEVEKDPLKSIEVTDRALGIKKRFI